MASTITETISKGVGVTVKKEVTISLRSMTGFSDVCSDSVVKVVSDVALGESTGKKAAEENVVAYALWTEDIVLDPGNVRYPIRVVLVDNTMRTRLDRLVQLPKNSTTYIYRVLDHGIPWQHLSIGLTRDEIKEQILSLVKGKELVVYDASKTIGIFEFTKQQLAEVKFYDVKTNHKSVGRTGQPLYWDLVREKLNHVYSGKPGNYDTVELADFIMRIYILYEKAKMDQPSPSQRACLPN